MPSTRQLQKAQTREKIIAAAFRVYAEQGFSAPTTAIASEAQVSHGSVFVHFPTVESLLICLLDIFAQDLDTELHALSESGNDIARLLDMHVEVLVKYENFYSRLVREASLLPGEARNTFVAIQSTAAIHFSNVLQPEIRAGKIKDIPFHMLFNTWLGLVHYYLLNGDLFAPGESVLTRCKDSLITCYMALIKTIKSN